MAHKIINKNLTEIKNLLKDLSNPSYATNAYADMGIDSLIVLRNVFRIDNSYLGEDLARLLWKRKNLTKNKIVLDLGCGCGIQGIICALNGAKEVNFSDINPIAINNSKLNARINGVKKSSFTVSNLFNNFPKKKFDVIIFNSPTIKGKPLNYYEAAFIREDNLMHDFFKIFPEYLSEDGILIMPGSTKFSKQTSPITLARKYKYKYKIIDKKYEGKSNYKFVTIIKK